jgi:hypothetical protein
MKILKGIATGLLWLLVLLSFTANALLLRLMLDARAQAAEAIQLGARAVSDLQAGALDHTLVVDREVAVDVVIPAGTELPTEAGAVTLSAEVSVPATVHLTFDAPVTINIADTPLNPSLLSARDFLDRLYAQWQRDPLQAFLAPLPPR